MRLRIVVSASLLAAFLVVAEVGAVSAAPRHGTALTIAVTPSAIISGEGVLIYGQLNLSDPGGKKIVLYHELAPGRTFTVVGTTHANAEGFYEFVRREGVVTTNRSWYVTGPGDARSRMVHETVSALLSMAASSSEGFTNRPLTFSGNISPGGHAGETVFLQEQTGLSGSGWNTIGRGVIDTSSNYAITLVFRQPGDLELRAMFFGDKRNAMALSNPVTVAIEQSENPAFTIFASAANGTKWQLRDDLWRPLCSELFERAASRDERDTVGPRIRRGLRPDRVDQDRVRRQLQLYRDAGAQRGLPGAYVQPACAPSDGSGLRGRR